MDSVKGKAALAALYADDAGAESDFLRCAAADFAAMLDAWHSRPQFIDAELEGYIHKIYTDPPQIEKPEIFFSPSSTGACPRSLYEQQKGAERDAQLDQPHRKRWTQIGTAIGDMIQKDILLIEKHDEAARFRFDRTAAGFPFFEEFATTCKKVELEGTSFYICGSPDGVMLYTDREGKEHRIGLEIKSKQTTPARTSRSSLKEAEAKHIDQVRTYAHLYGLDHYLIVYVNAAHKAWTMSAEDYEKTPDVRVFGIDCSEEKRLISLRKMAAVQKAVDQNVPPLPHLDKWTFNNYKTAIARSITDDELHALENQVIAVEAGTARDWIKRDYRNALAELIAMATVERGRV